MLLKCSRKLVHITIQQPQRVSMTTSSLSATQSIQQKASVVSAVAMLIRKRYCESVVSRSIKHWAYLIVAWDELFNVECQINRHDFQITPISGCYLALSNSYPISYPD